MRILSNLLHWRDARAANSASPVVRPVLPGETDAALRLVLSAQGAQVTEQHIRDFRDFARERDVDLGLLHVAEQEGKIVLAALAIISPGRTLLMFTSPPASRSMEAAAAGLIDAVCQAAGKQNVQLAQVLLDPADTLSRAIYTAAGFKTMAELIYLQCAARTDSLPPRLPPNFNWLNYSDATHGQFVRTIAASYRDSLDCPALNGVRDMQDVIEGHKASGVFDPKNWFLLSKGDQPMGVLILASSGANERSMELVYLGLPPEARGRNLGEILLRQAFFTLASEGGERLSLAVDARNVPALKLYYRHGMQRIASKWAMMRSL